MQATYWQLWMSFSVSFCLSYLRGHPRWSPAPAPTPPPPHRACGCEIINFTSSPSPGLPPAPRPPRHVRRLTSARGPCAGG